MVGNYFHSFNRFSISFFEETRPQGVEIKFISESKVEKRTKIDCQFVHALDRHNCLESYYSAISQSLIKFGKLLRPQDFECVSATPPQQRVNEPGPSVTISPKEILTNVRGMHIHLHKDCTISSSFSSLVVIPPGSELQQAKMQSRVV